MAKDHGRNDMRNRIAYLAARIMAEDGIEDYALAKRKAARQAGMPDSRQLPTNDEIDAALRVHHQLYQHDEHSDRLRALRERAASTMRELAHFDPHLAGSVLNGNAGKYADINLQLYTDNAKAVELYFIDRRILYKTSQIRLYSGEELRSFPVFTIDDDGTEVQLIVLSPRDLRAPLKTSPEGRPLNRARLPVVETLLAES
jgi:hypothetical protein